MSYVMTTIVMTGGTSGIGEVAVRTLMQQPDTRVLLGTRIKSTSPAETLALDLGRLDSVRLFASKICDRLGSAQIDALVLNAGVGLPDVNSRTPDGFEQTFAVNHLGHYLLIRLLLPHLAEKAVVVLTTSSTHDPAEKTIQPPPRHANAKKLAYPEWDPEHEEQKPGESGGHAYSASKLCNILTARALTTQPELKKRALTIIAYDPGPTPGTGLTRNYNFVVRTLWTLFGLPFFRPLLPRFNSRKEAGNVLASLALGNIRPEEGKVYGSLRKGKVIWHNPSELALNDTVMEALWRDSAELVELAE